MTLSHESRAQAVPVVAHVLQNPGATGHADGACQPTMFCAACLGAGTATAWLPAGSTAARPHHSPAGQVAAHSFQLSGWL